MGLPTKQVKLARKERNEKTVDAFEQRMHDWMTRGVETKAATEDAEAVYREPNCKEMAIIAVFCKRLDDGHGGGVPPPPTAEEYQNELQEAGLNHDDVLG